MVGPWFYVMLVLALLVSWPMYLLDIHPALSIVGAVVNLGLLVFVWRSCSSPTLSYWRGLNIIAGSMMSGCANISIIYVPVVVAGVYLLSVGYSVLGFRNRKRPASVRWEQLVLGFYERRIRDG